MNLLLLLSALLSALTGMGGVRSTPAPQAVCERSVEVRAVQAATALVALRPVQALPMLADVRREGGVMLVLTAVEPIFASRRRE